MAAGPARTPMLIMERVAEAAVYVTTALAARLWLAAAVPGAGVLPAIHVPGPGHIPLRVVLEVTTFVRIRSAHKSRVATAIRVINRPVVAAGLARTRTCPMDRIVALINRVRVACACAIAVILYLLACVCRSVLPQVRVLLLVLFRLKLIAAA